MSAMPLNAADVPLNVYMHHLEQGRLAYQYSLEADRAVFPPRLICPFSGSDRFEWRVSQGLGTVYSLTWIAPKERAPYCVALIDVDEGFRMMSRILPSGLNEPRIGDRVKLKVGRLSGQEEMLPLFEMEGVGHA